MKKRYAVAGASMRSAFMFCQPIERDFTDTAEVVGLLDINESRMNALNSYLNKQVPMYSDFRRMIGETKPDTVIVATRDSEHHTYIIAALEAGLDVITEKPMTIDDEKCRAILEAERHSRKTLTVVFNYRCTPLRRKMKEILKSGFLGEITAIDFHWYLDTSHGADYFRRWHRRMENSGGLLVHKATHHFDLVNWLTGDEPERVYAQGRLCFYGPNRQKRGDRCRGCAHRDDCEFYKDLSLDEQMVRFYLNAEQEDGYHRDGCVFSPEIDIYDTMSVNVRYRRGMLLNYSLIAYAPFEGWRMNLTGVKGRMEVADIETGSVPQVSPSRNSHDSITIYPLFGEAKAIRVPRAEGEHGGGDEVLRELLFRGLPEDPLKLRAGSRDGAMSVLIGVAANKSIRSGRPVLIDDLLRDHFGS